MQDDNIETTKAKIIKAYCGACDNVHDLMFDCRVGKVKSVGIPKALPTFESVLRKEIWNEAIEAAAITSNKLFDVKDFAREVCANEIRKLKK